jgi:hypothetical protein
MSPALSFWLMADSRPGDWNDEGRMSNDDWIPTRKGNSRQDLQDYSDKMTFSRKGISSQVKNLTNSLNTV